MAKASNVIFENWKWTVWETGKSGGCYDIKVYDGVQNKMFCGFVEMIEEGTELLFGGVAEQDEANVVINGCDYKIPKYIYKVIEDYYME